MCTAVVGGLIHRAATSISAANDQRSAAPMRSHRTKDRKELFRSGASECASGFSVTFQNNRLAEPDIVPRKSADRYLPIQRSNRCGLFSSCPSSPSNCEQL